MYEYKIIQITRYKERKSREIINAKGKIDTQIYIETEPFAGFYARAEKLINDLAGEGWQVINVNYSLPVQGNKELIGMELYYFSATDYNSAEFVFVMQRCK